jgi:hypothetical protein
MNTILLQFWEESERGWGIRPDGASLHIDKLSYQDYIKKIYSTRDPKNVPDEYERIVGDLVEVEIDDDLYELVSNDKNLRLAQYELNNLIKLENLKLND